MKARPQLPSGFRAGALLQLALPMIVSRAGLAVMAIADGVMVSRYRPVEFAWLTLADGTLGRLLDVSVAFLIGGLLLAPRHFARGDRAGAHQIWLRTVPVSLALGLGGAIAGLWGRQLLGLIGERADLAAGAAPVMAILGAGYPAALVAIAAAVYLEGIARPQVVAASVVGANVLNLALNWVLIGGHLGFAAMGARGSALSTTLMRWVLGAVLFGLAWRSQAAGQARSAAAALDQAASARTQWRLSLGSAASVFAMIVLSGSLIVLAGRLGALALAVFSAGWGLASPAMLIMMGLADATGVYVSAEDGRAGLAQASAVAWSSLRLTLAVVGTLALGLVLAANTCAGLYAKDAGLRRPIAAIVPLVALILVADAIGFILASSLRAIREAAWPAAIEIGAMLAMVPVAASLALWRGLGVRGLFLAMLAASLARAALLAARFAWRTRSAGQRDGRPSAGREAGTESDPPGPPATAASMNTAASMTTESASYEGAPANLLEFPCQEI